MLKKTAVAKNLNAILEKLQHGWCQGYFAKNKDGNSVSAISEDAVAWTVPGAFVAVYDPLELSEEEKVVWGILTKQAGTASLMEWNNAPTRSHEQVFDLIREAITYWEISTLEEVKPIRKKRVKDGSGST